jgi:hypothetical protein
MRAERSVAEQSACGLDRCAAFERETMAIIAELAAFAACGTRHAMV